MNTPSEANGIAVALTAGMQLGQPKLADGGGQIPYAIVPEGTRLQFLPPTEWPHRKRGTIIVRDLASLLRYCEAHMQDSGQIIYVDHYRLNIVAVLNDHQVGVAGFRDHRVIFPLLPSRQWVVWATCDGKALSQAQFGEFLENNLDDIAQPEGATILEMVLDFRVHQEAQFVSQQVLRSGQTVLTYDETLEDGGGKGKMPLPNELRLHLPVFQDGEARDLRARLRYRLVERKLSLRFELVQPAAIIEARLGEIVANLSERWPGMVIMGTPE